MPRASPACCATRAACRLPRLLAGRLTLHNARRLPQRSEEKLAALNGRTRRAKKAEELASAELSPPAVRYEASLPELTSEIGREINPQTGKQDGFNCMPIALATRCTDNKFVGAKAANIRTLIASAMQKLLDDNVYGHGRLVRAEVLGERRVASSSRVLY